MSMPPPVPVPGRDDPAPTGRTLVSSAWSALRHDRELIALPVIGAVVALLAIVPLVAVALIPDEPGTGSYVLGVAAAFVAAIVSTFFAVALAAGAHARMNGGDPTIRSALQVAWKHKGGVIGWAILSTTVGMVLRAIEERFKAVGSIIRFAGDVAWALASFFVIPIIAANDCGPIEALKLSATTFKNRWSSAVRVSLRLWLYGLGLAVGGFLALMLVVAISNASVPLAIVVGVLLGLAFLVAVLLLSALASYARVALYRYAAGMPTPGFSDMALAGAVRPKR